MCLLKSTLFTNVFLQPIQNSKLYFSTDTNVEYRLHEWSSHKRIIYSHSAINTVLNTWMQKKTIRCPLVVIVTLAKEMLLLWLYERLQSWKSIKLNITKNYFFQINSLDTILTAYEVLDLLNIEGSSVHLWHSISIFVNGALYAWSKKHIHMPQGCGLL